MPNGAPFIRPVVQRFQAYEPGKSIEEVRSLYGLERVIKLASNENPLGASPLVREVVRAMAPDSFRYPAGGNPRLVRALAAHYGVDPARIMVTNGSDETIDLLFRVCAEPGVHNVVAFRPCFGIYVTQARMAGVELRQAPLNEDFSFPWDKLLAQVDHNTTMVFVTSPDNPSGRAATAIELSELADKLPEHVMLVLDEAYVDFARKADGGEKAFSLLNQLERHPRVAILRTFSKSWGMAGLRLGCAILSPTLAEHLWRVRLPFSVNLLAEEAALAALRDTDFRNATLQAVEKGRAFLETALRDFGCRVIPSQANFLMFFVPHNGPEGAAFNEALLRRGFILRWLNSYRLPSAFRLTVGNEEENRLVIEAMGEILQAARQSGREPSSVIGG